MYGRGNIMAIISKSWQSWFNNLSHSERSEESPPFAKRKEARGMLTCARMTEDPLTRPKQYNRNEP